VEIKIQGTPPDGELVATSPTWIFIEKWAKEEIQKLREGNDNGRHGLVETSMIRGEIKLAKKLISLGNPLAFVSPSQRRGILARVAETEEERDYSNYAGY